VILADHSMGGIAITQAAENCPQYIGALVYVCASSRATATQP
jgi:hypothetical protein